MPCIVCSLLEKFLTYNGNCRHLLEYRSHLFSLTQFRKTETYAQTKQDSVLEQTSAKTPPRPALNGYLKLRILRPCVKHTKLHYV